MISRLVEVLQPLSARADQLGSMALFDGFRWTDLEELAANLDEVRVPRGTRMTVQGRMDNRFWLIVDGEALVSADARPLRVAGHGDPVGLSGVIYGIRSPETTIALAPIRPLTAGPHQFQELIAAHSLRRRLTALAGDHLRHRRPWTHRTGRDR